MKIALELRQNKEKIIKDLKERKFEVDENSSFGTLWVYEIKNISYLNNLRDGHAFFLENNNLITYKIYLDDVAYYEIHN